MIPADRWPGAAVIELDRRLRDTQADLDRRFRLVAMLCVLVVVFVIVTVSEMTP